MQNESFEKIGNFLFKYRGQLPLILVLSSIPFILHNSQRSNEAFIENLFYLFSFIFISMGHLIRFIAIGYKNLHSSGKNRDEQVANKLNTKGVYSIVRHPLYLANLLIWLGVLCVVQNVYFVLLGILFFSFLYYFIIYVEEGYLRKKFKSEHEVWAKKTPVFLPNFRNYKKIQGDFNWKMVWKNEYPGICATFSCIWFIHLLRIFFLDKDLLNPYLIASAVVIAFFGFGSKYLKHKTNFFPKDG